jgi:hypothetical protein
MGADRSDSYRNFYESGADVVITISAFFANFLRKSWRFSWKAALWTSFQCKGCIFCQFFNYLNI